MCKCDRWHWLITHTLSLPEWPSFHGNICSLAELTCVWDRWQHVNYVPLFAVGIPIFPWKHLLFSWANVYVPVPDDIKLITCPCSLPAHPSFHGKNCSLAELTCMSVPGDNMLIMHPIFPGNHPLSSWTNVCVYVPDDSGLITRPFLQQGHPSFRGNTRSLAGFRACCCVSLAASSGTCSSGSHFCYPSRATKTSSPPPPSGRWRHYCRSRAAL